MISVVIPAYNVAPTIGRALRSILSQTCPPGEIIIIDDGSTDATNAVVREEISRTAVSIHVRLVHQEHSGTSDARNRGLDCAQGDWICFVDADDELPPTALEHLYGEAESEFSPDIVYGSYQEFASDGRNHPAYRQPYRYNIRTSGRKALGYYLDGRIPSVVWAALYRRLLFKNIRFVSGMGHQDAEIQPRLILSAQRVRVIPEVVYCYLRRRGSFMDTLLFNRIDSIDAQLQLESLAARTFRSPRVRARAAAAVVSAAVGIACHIHARSEDRAVKDQWRRMIYRRVPRKRLFRIACLPLLRLSARIDAVALAIAPRMAVTLRILRAPVVAIVQRRRRRCSSWTARTIHEL